jgi:hypothetical protein
VRARRDSTSDGSTPAVGRRRVGPVTMTVAGAVAFMTVFVVGVWMLAPGQSRSDASTGAQTSASVPASGQDPAGVTATASAPTSFLGDDDAVPEVQTTPPAAAPRAARAFATAWRLPGSPAKRREALGRVASPYLVSSLATVLEPLPKGHPDACRLVGGSATAAQYRVSFSSGEAITVSVTLTGRRWVATQVAPAPSDDQEPTGTTP